MSIAYWWFTLKLRWQVDKYLHHAEQLDEWSNRYIADTPREVAKKQWHINHHKSAKVLVVNELWSKLNLPVDMWFFLGDGRKIKLVSDSDYNLSVEVKDA